MIYETPTSCNSIKSSVILLVLILSLVHINVTHSSLYVKFVEKIDTSSSSIGDGLHVLSCRNLVKNVTVFNEIDVSGEIGERLVKTLKDSMVHARVLKPPDRTSYLRGTRTHQRKSEKEPTLNGHGTSENRKICNIMKEVMTHEKDQRRRGYRSGTSDNILSISIKKMKVNQYESALLRGAKSIHNVIESNLEKMGNQIIGLADVARNVLTLDQFPQSDAIKLNLSIKTE
eukprot:CAMPEP_0194222744 /NCGR_PEP_ID=MMETSP0156-20130528/33675_1 /TAXON_ID=33649 /ORGANISM="Thalassionema nitzschioides, Strain L26-B" /LENGTH=229 /DNA_ID=CAMNT_0038953667 /DNA_START=31 /DNA_END=720 /DNA_ORIENTATION=+